MNDTAAALGIFLSHDDNKPPFHAATAIVNHPIPAFMADIRVMEPKNPLIGERTRTVIIEKGNT